MTLSTNSMMSSAPEAVQCVAIHRAVFPQVDHFLGHLRGRAEQKSVVTFRAAHHLTRCQLLVLEQVGKAKPHAHGLPPVGIRHEALVVQRSIRVEAIGIQSMLAHEPLQQAIFRSGSTVEFVLAKRFFAALAQNDNQPGHDTNACRIPAERNSPLFRTLLPKALPAGLERMLQ